MKDKVNEIKISYRKKTSTSKALSIHSSRYAAKMIFDQ